MDAEKCGVLEGRQSSGTKGLFQRRGSHAPPPDRRPQAAPQPSGLTSQTLKRGSPKYAWCSVASADDPRILKSSASHGLCEALMRCAVTATQWRRSITEFESDLLWEQPWHPPGSDGRGKSETEVRARAL